MSKRCWKCKETKPLDEFHRHARRKDGRQTACKVCARSAGRAQYAQHSHQTGKVYRLTCTRSGFSYIGSTQTSLTKRLWSHRAAAKAGKQTAVHSHMRTFADDAFWNMELLRDFGHIDRDTLRSYEQQAIEEIQPNLNVVAACAEEAQIGHS